MDRDLSVSTIPYSPFPIPRSLFPVPYSPFPIPFRGMFLRLDPTEEAEILIPSLSKPYFSIAERLIIS